MRLAIRPDTFGFSDAWTAEARRRGIEVVLFDETDPGAMDVIRGSHGLLWRFGGPDEQAAKRILATSAQVLGVPTLPDAQSAARYGDKLGQTLALQAARLPIPESWIFWDANEASTFLEHAPYPLVMKLAGGAASTGVMSLRGVRQARRVVRRLFGRGFDRRQIVVLRRDTRHGAVARQAEVSARRLKRFLIPVDRHPRDHGYFYVQRRLPTRGDYRVVIVGDRIGGVVLRKSPASDFRASGSGSEIHLSADETPVELLELAVAGRDALGMRSCAFDMMLTPTGPVVIEFAYACSWQPLMRAPGHWVLDPRGSPHWTDRPLDIRLAMFDDFMSRVQAVAA